ncbi:MAG: hypothetical protein WC836_06600 [Desulfobacula sp.]
MRLSCRNKNKSALNAWFREEADTFFSTARQVRNSLTSDDDRASGDFCRVWYWNFSAHRVVVFFTKIQVIA